MAMKHRVKERGRIFEVVISYWQKTPGPYKYSAEVPVLPGCFSDGRTRREAIENIKEAIDLYLDVLDQRLAKKDVVMVKV